MSERRALICEDDASIRALVKTVIARQGFTVDVAEDGALGIDRIEEDCYELIVLDLMMPKVDGYAVIDYLRNRRPKTLKRVIIMTAATEALRTEFPAPICTLIPKPFNIESLTAAVESCANACGTD